MVYRQYKKDTRDDTEEAVVEVGEDAIDSSASSTRMDPSAQAGQRFRDGTQSKSIRSKAWNRSAASSPLSRRTAETVSLKSRSLGRSASEEKPASGSVGKA